MLPSRVKILTTQYVWKYDQESNTHAYFRVPAGSEGTALRLAANQYGTLFYFVSLPSGDCLKLSPTIVELVK